MRPSTSSVLRRPVAPLAIRKALFGTPRRSARNRTSSSLAAPFTGGAASEPTPTYRWQYSSGGAWLAATGTVNGCVYTNDTTATLTCTPTTTGQSGLSHRCVVSNGAGATESTSAVLTIT